MGATKRQNNFGINTQLPWYDIQQEGKLKFDSKTNAGLGHVLAVKTISLHATQPRLVATLLIDASDTATTYRIPKNIGYQVGNIIGYSPNSKGYPITSINTSDVAFDVITLSFTLGINILAGDTIEKVYFDYPIEYNIGTLKGGLFESDNYSFYAGKISVNSSIVLQVDKILQQGEQLLLQKGTNEKNGDINYVVSGYKISADTNFDAERVMYCLGDSIANLSSYVNRFGGHMHWQARTALNAIRINPYDKGYDCRIVSDSMSGKNSTDLVNDLKAGMKIIRRANLILFQHGINDAYQGTSDGAWNANLTYMIAWRDANYPDAKLVFVGATPLKTGDTYLTRLGQLRTIEATYHDPSNNVYYVSLESAYPDVSSGSPYFTDSIHPSQLGHDACATILNPFLAGIV